MAQDIVRTMAWWNNTFPLDRWYRKKHNIAFNSPEHRRVNPIDIYKEYIEDGLFDEYEKRQVELEEGEELARKGIWISKPKVSQAKRDELWKKLSLSKLNEQSNAIKVDG